MSDDSNIVKSVLYGVVVSIVIGEASNHLPNFALQASGFCEQFAICKQLVNYCVKNPKFIMLFWMIYFVSMYFYDECKGHDKKEPIFSVLIGWLSYMIQASLIVKNIFISGVFGIIGTTFITIGLLFTIVQNRMWYVVENVIWCVALLCICSGSCGFWIPFLIIGVRVLRGLLKSKKGDEINE